MLAAIADPPEQLHFASTVHEASHPSPGAIPPSSQYVAAGLIGIIFPSPQTSFQRLGVLISPRVQLQPVSTVQLKSHPSPLLEFPSSQYPTVGMATYPSPQISVQRLGVFASPRVHCHLDSTAQDASQPSPGVVSPSSQYPVVGFTTKPSPHISDHELAVVVLPPDHCHLVSIVHDASHPSPEVMSPSSQ